MTINREHLAPCPFCGEVLRINNAQLAVHSRDSDCLLRQQPVVIDDPQQVARWNRRAQAAPEAEPEYYLPEYAGSGQRGVCIKCNKGPDSEGHDGCLGTLPGPIMNACCGHGRDSQAYIQYWDGTSVRGDEAVIEQARLINAAPQNDAELAELLARVESLLACPQHHVRKEYIAAAADLRAKLATLRAKP